MYLSAKRLSWFWPGMVHSRQKRKYSTGVLLACLLDLEKAGYGEDNDNGFSIFEYVFLSCRL